MSIRTFASMLFALAACSDGGTAAPPDAPALPPDSSTDCNPATVLPSNYRLIAMTSTGAVAVTTVAGVTTGTIDATAGGIAGAADNPYIYVDLRNGVKVDVNDLDARTNTTWDIALKRSSMRTNGGDSGQGNRKVSVVAAASLAAVTAAPTAAYGTDDFTTADCMLEAIPGGEPMSAFGEWYSYDGTTHAVTPKGEVYVIERNNGSHTAFRVVSYYGDTAMPMRGAYYKVEWKQL
jgi:hypothetical protein